MGRICEGLRSIQAQAQGMGAFGRGAQSGAALAACGRRPKAAVQGESLDDVSREVGVEISRLERWRDKAMRGFEEGLRER